ncbi:putative ribonuclease H-like domain-containing protein, partial [Tanacetum coccineum]
MQVKLEKKKVHDQEYILLPLLHTNSYIPSSFEKDKSSPKDNAEKKNEVKDSAKENDLNDSGEDTNADKINRLNIGSSPVNSASSSFSYEDQERPREQRNEFESVFGQDKNAYKAFTPVNAVIPFDYPTDPLMPDLEDTDNLQNTGIFGNGYDDEDVGAEADMNNFETTMSVRPIPTTRVNKDHPKAQILGEMDSAVQTRRMHKQHEADRTKEELPYGKKAIGTKWVFRNKKDQKGIVVRNKARLVVQSFKQEEGIDYDEVFAPVVRIEAIRLFLAYASYMDFTVYQMDVKSAFLYGTIEEEVYVCQPPGFVDPEFPDKVYKVEKALYGLHQAPRAWHETLSTYLIENGFRRGTIDKTLFIKKFKNDILLVQVYVDDIIFGSTNKSLRLQVEQRTYGIFLSQDKYVYEILKKFGYSNMMTASTPMETHKLLVKDENGSDVDVHLYRYLKGQPTLGLLYPKDSPLELIAYSDSDYAGASIDRKSTTGGCQFLGCRLVSWQCKKQTIVAKSTTEAEYIAASNCCAHVLWLQNQLLDYGYNYMKTKIHVDNESAICVVKNHVSHSKTKHIEIRFHFIKDCYEKRLIEMVKIHTNHNFADLLTKAFDVTRFKFLIASIDAAGISNLPDAEIYAELATLGPKSGGWDQFGSPLATALICLSSNRIYNFSKLIFDGMVQLRIKGPTPTSVADEATTIGVEVDAEGATTTATSGLDAGLDSGIDGACTKIRIKDTKQTFGKAILTLVDRVKTLEVALKRKSKKIVLSDSEDEETEAQGRKIKELDDDHLVSLVKGFVTPSKTTISALGEEQVEDISPTTLEAAKTLSRVASQKPKSVDKGRRYKRRKGSKRKDINTGLDFEAEVSTGFEDTSTGYEDINTGFDRVNTGSLEVSTGSGPVSTPSTKVSIPSPDKGQREGKAPMIIEETQAPKRTKEQIQQEEASFAEAIRAKLEANVELTKSVLGKDFPEEDFAKKMGTWKLTQLKKLSFEEVKEEFDKLVKHIETFVPMSFEATKAGLKRYENEAEKDMDTSEKDDSASGINIPINHVPVATKSPSIANYKIIKQGKKGVYQIVRENGTDKVYISFRAMLKDISRDDLTELYRIVMQRYG